MGSRSDHFQYLYCVRYVDCEIEGSAAVIPRVRKEKMEYMDKYGLDFVDWVLNDKEVKGILKSWDDEDEADKKTLGIK